MNNDRAADTTRVLFIALPDQTGRIDEDWLKSLPARGGLSVKRWKSTRRPQPTWTELLAAARELDSDQGLMLIRSGLKLPAGWQTRLAGSVASDPGLPRIPAGNYADPVNPMAGLPAGLEPEALDGWLWLCAEHRATPIDDFPLACVYLPPGAALALSDQTSAVLVDSLYVHDPARCLDAGSTKHPTAASALGPARMRLRALLDDLPAMDPPRVGLDGRPVTLHISHDWGGGVARWIADVVRADDRGHHLVLSASGDPRGTVHGQQLRLYAAGPGQGLVRELPLSPAIADSVVADARYRELLEHLIKRFGITRILVSSLIGHSLDALDTELPTALVLHDFYPAWPLLDQDPLAWSTDGDTVDLARALAEHGDRLLFGHRQAEHWRQLSTAWLACVKARGIPLLAPSFGVLKRWQALTGDPLTPAQVIGHGFSGWPTPPQRVHGRARTDGRLHLVVTGRLSQGKGLNLLDRALDGLRPLAHVTLLGCGRHGMRFFGRPGVDIVLDYERDQLPELMDGLAPQAALFLSTVPETWNYTLSEVRSLGIPPLATRLGSFVERIDHGRNGWLFDPEPDALVELVAKLKAEPRQLADAAALPAEESDVDTVLKRYWQLVPASGAACPPLSLTEPLALAAARLSSRLVEKQLRLDLLVARVDELDRELAQRADWASRYERLSEERTRWARALEQDVESERAVIRDLTVTFDRQRRELQQELGMVRTELGSTHEALAGTRNQLAISEQQLVQTAAELSARLSELQQIFASRSWRWTRPLRFISRVLAQARRYRAWNPLRWPRLSWRLVHSLRLHGLSGTLHLAQGTLPPAAERATLPVVETPTEQPQQEPVNVPRADQPRASIIIPVYNKLAYTAACLKSIAAEASDTTFEVIVVDDCSSDATPEFLGECSGLEVVRNAENSGFIASCNAGAERARGEFLVFLNNDTTVTTGWLEALLQTFKDFAEAGIVGARLVYPDGRLQEAGGIIFSDASGWNYGRGESPDAPQYNFAAEADYVSGACLAIRRALFEDLEGFDRHYAPAYYEDTDLCFRVRERGLRVLCQPACTIIHHEGVSSGTDESGGTKRYQAINREKFLERWQEALRRQPEHHIDSERADPVRRARFHRARGRALLIDATTPMPDHDSGSVRFTALLELIIEHGWQVSFMPQNLTWEGRYSSALQRRGVEVLSAPAVTSAEAWLKACGEDLDLVLVSRHYVLDPLLKLIRRHCPHARLVFDTVDLHFLREQRQAELSGSASMKSAAERTRRIELGLMRSSDTTLVVSSVEQSLLAEQVPEADVRVLSNIHSVRGRRHGWAARRDLMFVGGFQHPPNVDAAEWLIDEIFPRVRAELPELRLHLIGSRMPEAMREKASDGVIMHGFVEDLTPYLEGCRLSLAPLRYGAGVKGKVNQAMAWGQPVVATSCAAEGMFLVHGEDVLMAEDSETFAAEVLRAYTDEDLWLRLSDGGLANVERYFSRAAAARVVNELLDDARSSTGERISRDCESGAPR